MKKKLISTLTTFFTTALVAFLLSVLLLNLLTLWTVGKIKQGETVTAGYFCAIVGSGSMRPSISTNDLLVINGGGSYQTQDIVTYVSPQGTLITHRIKEISDRGYITQGDANNIPDEEITGQRVLGRVVVILPRVGGIITGMISSAGIILFVCLCASVHLIQRIRRAPNEE